MEKKYNFKIGDSVVVKKGTKAPEFGCEIGGWQGRIFDILKNDQGEDIMEIVWDSVTLKNMPSSFIENCENNDWDWGRMNLEETMVEPAQPRDTEDDVWDARDQVGFLDSMEVLGEEGKSFMEPLDRLGLDEDVKAGRVWWNKLRKEMIFPFEARVNLYMEEEGDLKQDDIVEVRRLSDLDDFLGVLVEVIFKGEKYTYALSELEATDPKSPNYRLTLDYREWFNKRDI
jgi:hypothetical protein